MVPLFPEQEKDGKIQIRSLETFHKDRCVQVPFVFAAECFMVTAFRSSQVLKK